MKATSPRLRLHRELWRHTIPDPTFWSLLASNAVTLAFAVLEQWPLLSLLWIYWTQSVVLGAFHFCKILDLRRFTTTGLKLNDQTVPPTRRTQVRVARFFLVHYGFFHLGYAVFLAVQSLPPAEHAVVALCAAGFLLHHGYSYLRNRASDRERLQNLGIVLFSPYGRILPMHLTIVFGHFTEPTTTGLVLFCLLKSAVDLAGHALSHVVREHPDHVDAVLVEAEAGSKPGS